VAASIRSLISGSEPALALYRLNYILLAVKKLLERLEALLYGENLNLVKTAGSFLAVARYERDCRAFRQEAQTGGNMLFGQLHLACDYLCGKHLLNWDEGLCGK